MDEIAAVQAFVNEAPDDLERVSVWADAYEKRGLWSIAFGLRWCVENRKRPKSVQEKLWAWFPALEPGIDAAHQLPFQAALGVRFLRPSDAFVSAALAAAASEGLDKDALQDALAKWRLRRAEQTVAAPSAVER